MTETRWVTTQTDLRGADLRERAETLRAMNLWRASLAGADLRGMSLAGWDLRRTNLADADLIGADLKRADLRDANLGGAVLTDALLLGADLRGAYLVARGNQEKAVSWYAKGYYYEAKRMGLLKETGLRG